MFPHVVPCRAEPNREFPTEIYENFSHFLITGIYTVNLRGAARVKAKRPDYVPPRRHRSSNVHSLRITRGEANLPCVPPLDNPLPYPPNIYTKTRGKCAGARRNKKTPPYTGAGRTCLQGRCANHHNTKQPPITSCHKAGRVLAGDLSLLSVKELRQRHASP